MMPFTAVANCSTSRAFSPVMRSILRPPCITSFYGFLHDPANFQCGFSAALRQAANFGGHYGKGQREG